MSQCLQTQDLLSARSSSHLVDLLPPCIDASRLSLTECVGYGQFDDWSDVPVRRGSSWRNTVADSSVHEAARTRTRLEVVELERSAVVDVEQPGEDPSEDLDLDPRAAGLAHHRGRDLALAVLLLSTIWAARSLGAGSLGADADASGAEAAQPVVVEPAAPVEPAPVDFDRSAPTQAASANP